MAHIALVTGLLTGRIYSSFEMAVRLQKEGHSITYLCQPKTQKRIEENGFVCVPVPEISFSYNYPKRAKMESSWLRKFIFHIGHLKSHYPQGEKILKLDEHKEVLRKVKPDLILIDNEIHDLIFTAFELKIPMKLTTDWFSDKICNTSPSIRTGIIPGEGMGGTKMGILFSWLLMRTKIYGRVLMNKLTFENYRRYVLKTYAKNIGFDMSDLMINTLPPLYSFKKSPVISMAMSELEFPHRLAENITYVGPMVYENRIFKTSGSDQRQQLNQVFKMKSEEHKKLVYCSVGSLAQGYLPFLKKVIEAVANIDEVVLIMSIGPKMTLDSFENVPQNVYLFNWVPQLDVLKTADCCITHCGINSINECIHHSVPMLLYSGKYTDENGNAARMAYHGLGVQGDIVKDSAAQIKANLEQVLANSEFKEKVTQFHRVYLTYNTRPLTPLLFDF